MSRAADTLREHRHNIAEWLCDHGSGFLFSKTGYLRRADNLIDHLAALLDAAPAADREALAECHEAVSRKGESQPCNKPAVAMRYDPTEGSPYPVCAHHSRADMVPLALLAGTNTAEPDAGRIAEVLKPYLPQGGARLVADEVVAAIGTRSAEPDAALRKRIEALATTWETSEAEARNEGRSGVLTFIKAARDLRAALAADEGGSDA